MEYLDNNWDSSFNIAEYFDQIDISDHKVAENKFKAHINRIRSSKK